MMGFGGLVYICVIFYVVNLAIGEFRWPGTWSSALKGEGGALIM